MIKTYPEDVLHDMQLLAACAWPATFDVNRKVGAEYMVRLQADLPLTSNAACTLAGHTQCRLVLARTVNKNTHMAWIMTTTDSFSGIAATKQFTSDRVPSAWAYSPDVAMPLDENEVNHALWQYVDTLTEMHSLLANIDVDNQAATVNDMLADLYVVLQGDTSAKTKLQAIAMTAHPVTIDVYAHNTPKVRLDAELPPMSRAACELAGRSDTQLTVLYDMTTCKCTTSLVIVNNAILDWSTVATKSFFRNPSESPWAFTTSMPVDERELDQKLIVYHRVVCAVADLLADIKLNRTAVNEINKALTYCAPPENGIVHMKMMVTH